MRHSGLNTKVVRLWGALRLTARQFCDSSPNTRKDNSVYPDCWYLFGVVVGLILYLVVVGGGGGRGGSGKVCP